MDEAQIDPWRDHLGREGIAIEAEVAWPEGGHSIYFRDPSGNSVELATGARGDFWTVSDGFRVSNVVWRRPTISTIVRALLVNSYWGRLCSSYKSKVEGHNSQRMACDLRLADLRPVKTCDLWPVTC
jgi:hypothetical protein